MEGLVDYGVDSDRESNDSPNPENTSVSYSFYVKRNKQPINFI